MQETKGICNDSTNKYNTIISEYVERFKPIKDPLLFRSPGRINLIGEHTDYNDGFVMPAAIDKTVEVAIGLREDEEIHLFSQEFHDAFSIPIVDIQPVKGWPTYVLGVVNEFKKKGLPIHGFNMMLYSDVPIGAGLSSSAAVECATAFAINELFRFSIPRMELVKMAQNAEHEYAFVKCGIMDQFASMFGKKNNAISLDCRTLEYEYFPLRMEDTKIILLDTQVKHSLSSSEYNIRRSQCEEGVAAINKKYPSVKKLRDVNPYMLQECLAKDSILYNRCLYVIEENNRLKAACQDLLNSNLKGFGKKMFSTHKGLSELYEVSCHELDFLVDAVKTNSDVLGARMMGGGFGGCTINIVKKSAVDTLIENISVKYEQAMNKKLNAYVVQIENGTTKF